MRTFFKRNEDVHVSEKQASVWGREDDARFETAGNTIGMTRL